MSTDDDNAEQLRRQARALEAIVTAPDGTRSTIPIRDDPAVPPALYEALQGLVSALSGWERYGTPLTRDIIIERLQHARAVMAMARGNA